MARKVTQPLRKKRAVKPYRQYGFRSQQAYDNWLKRWSSVPESDPRYFRRNLRGHARAAEITRVKYVIKRRLTPAKRMREKMRILVDARKTMSPFNFLDRYMAMIMAMLHDPATSDYDKKVLRRMLRELKAQISVDPNMEAEIGEQQILFR